VPSGKKKKAKEKKKQQGTGRLHAMKKKGDLYRSNFKKTEGK